jgi:hypothetical protein
MLLLKILSTLLAKVRTHIHTNVCTYKRTNVYKCTWSGWNAFNTYIQTYKCTQIYMIWMEFFQLYLRRYVHIYIHTYACTYVHTYAWVNTHIYTHMHTCIHVQFECLRPFLIHVCSFVHIHTIHILWMWLPLVLISTCVAPCTYTYTHSLNVASSSLV